MHCKTCHIIGILILSKTSINHYYKQKHKAEMAIAVGRQWKADTSRGIRFGLLN